MINLVTVVFAINFASFSNSLPLRNTADGANLANTFDCASICLLTKIIYQVIEIYTTCSVVSSSHPIRQTQFLLQ